ncbi:DEAD/DEAH box helicase family protein [Methylobacterium sp. J-030]|uniref:DEAD/DEAH box helicase family protein n=1 Tax=Methylobacterium sp. J-030 TaxID=2836627 RepID=UPI001FB9B8D6|nr:DEAD/DEAH box helicase family protein [Methylobacterium sp. J-030]MCJ2069237.1 DEAD/DEAH box helicase family protein [Methylobacterium sp. J-030]
MNCSGLRAGAGKTHAYASIAIERSQNKFNTIIISPTVKLLTETDSVIRSLNPIGRIVKFYSDDGGDGSVTIRVLAYLKHHVSPGDILLITQQCFINLPYFYHKSKWRLLVDEDIPVFVSETLNLPDSHNLITDHIELGETGPNYARVRIVDSSKLKRIVDNKNRDDVWSNLRPMCSLMLQSDCECYVNSKQLNDLKSNVKSKGQLTVYGFRKPDRFLGFDGVTIASAWFEDSLTYYHWKNLGVNWREDDDIKRSILRPRHPENPRLTIYYGYEGRNSKNLQHRLEKEGNTDLRDAIKQLMEGRPFLWVENKDRADTSILNQCENGVPLPPVSAGLNAYSDYRNAAVLMATNYDPGQSEILKQVIGFDGEKQARAMVGNLYQAFLRTALRKDEIGDEAKWVVTCLEEAKLLSERFPGSTIKPLGLAPLPDRKTGRPRKHTSDNDRKRNYERRRKDELTQSVGFARNLAPDLLERVVFLDETGRKTYNSIGTFVRDFRGSYFKTWHETNPLCITMTENQFIGYLKKRFKEVYSQKNDIPCIAGALFDPALTKNENTRYQGNVALSRGIWIDIEDGDLTPKMFEQAFPAIPFIAYSTFRHTRQKPRFRIYIPTDRPMLFEESIAIYHEIRYTLKTQGWMKGKKTAKRCASIDRRFDGIDCRPNPSQLSVLPCQSQDRKASFFLDYTKEKESLTVDVWLKQRSWFEGDDDFYDLPAVSDNGENAELTPEQSVIIRAATDRWETFGKQNGNGDAGIFALYLELRRARISSIEMEWRLYRAAEQSSSPKDRKDQIRRLIQNLRRKAF